MTYDEKADFAHHEGEVRVFFETLSACGYEPIREHTVLDLGGGQGMHVGALTQRFGRVWCLDVVDYTMLYGGEFIKLLIEKHQRNGMPLAADRLTFVQGDATALLFRDNFFDAILCINAFEHIPDPGKALAEIIRVLRPGGLAYISFDPVWTCDTGSHFFQRFPEPWAHLVQPEATYIATMVANGAGEDEVRELRTAMNRWRIAQFRQVFDAARDSGSVEIVVSRSWSGLQEPSHARHANLRLLLSRGFTEEELMMRGLLYVVRKSHALTR
jgi:ubiquinone/menaquinone biosynthesis C-methylase UbiE